MSHTPHELDAEFPDHVADIDRLKIDDPHFAVIANEYHTLNREIHRAEIDVTPVADHVLEDMKKRRLSLLDEIATILREKA